MNIIVVGCGKIGLTILSNLVAEGHNVMAVDTNPVVIEETNNIYDVMGVCGNGADCEPLEEAGVSKADLVIACTNSDENNAKIISEIFSSDKTNSEVNFVTNLAENESKMLLNRFFRLKRQK